MKKVINSCYGGFALSFDWKAKNCGDCPNKYCRDCPKLIQAIENDEDVSGLYSQLRVAEFPDDATDWEIGNYNGLEEVLYIQNGKIYRAW